MRNLALVLITWSAACATVPRPVSPPPTPPAQPALRAGFGRVDITPPPGGGLFGYGPEGKKAVGYRMRLYARALVLEDATGERIAFVVTDLGANSVLVHRFAARATLPLGIGADRMLLAASHTHAGPTHHFGLIHDVFASGGEMGFDWPWAMELSGRVAKAVEMAVQDLRPARAGWRTFPVWSVTHNRNLLPYSKNQVPWQSRFTAPAGLTPEQKAIDPSWSMLKVETRAADGTYRPAGAVSIFAMHATGAPSANDLYDADLHGMVSSEIERGIDRLNNVPQRPTPDAFHLFAQGSEGDASAMPPETRCPVPTLINSENYGANPPLTVKLIADPKRWEAPPHEAVDRCIASSRARMQAVAQQLSAQALTEFASISTSDAFRIRRVFTTIYPKELRDQFCAEPRLGFATLAGPIDGETRQTKAKIRYIEQGGSAVDNGPHKDALRRCHAQKRFMEIRLGIPIIEKLKQSDMYKLGLTPREAQLMVVQLGTQVLATMPAEITTTTGGRMKDAIAGALGLADSTRVSAVAVTNGYLNYVATADEYKEQYYEGSSTLFGPNSAEAFKNILVAMAKQLPAANEASPAPLVGKAKVWRDPPPVHRFASAREGPETVARCFTRPNMIGNTMVFRFRDWYPGRLLRAAYPLLQIETRGSGDWRPLTWDDDPQLEIRAIRKDGRRGHWWEVRWTPDQLPAQWRVVLTRRGENEAIYSDDARAICPLT